MNRKTATILLSVVLIVTFFLPFYKVEGFRISPYDFVFEKGAVADAKGTVIRFVWLLIPLSALLLLGSALGGVKVEKNILNWLPLATLGFFVFRYYFIVKTPGGHFTDFLFSGYAAIGFWIALVASLLLAFADLPDV